MRQISLQLHVHVERGVVVVLSLAGDAMTLEERQRHSILVRQNVCLVNCY